MRPSILLSLLIMSATVYVIRALPFVLLRRNITNPFLRSFLYYDVPYVTLAVMTFPAIITATDSPWSGLLALIVGVFVSLVRGDLFTVALSSCVTVFLSELFLVH